MRGNFNSKNCISSNFPPKLSKKKIFYNFVQKKCNLDTLPLLKVKNREKLFHIIFAHQGKNNFLGRIFTYLGLISYIQDRMNGLGSKMIYIRESNFLDSFIVSPMCHSVVCEKYRKSLPW